MSKPGFIFKIETQGQVYLIRELPNRLKSHSVKSSIDKNTLVGKFIITASWLSGIGLSNTPKNRINYIPAPNLITILSSIGAFSSTKVISHKSIVL